MSFCAIFKPSKKSGNQILWLKQTRLSVAIEEGIRGTTSSASTQKVKSDCFKMPEDGFWNILMHQEK